jgi:uncharacterized cupin superfamily protein
MADKTILLFEAKTMSVPKGERATLGPDDIFGTGRDIVWSATDGVSTGCVQWNGRASSSGFPHTETLVVVSGRLRLYSEGSTLELLSGDSAVIGRGTQFTAEAEAGTRWIYCATTAATSTMSGVVAIHKDAPLAPSAPPPPQYLDKVTPQCSNFRAFDETAGLRAGVWASTPHTRLSRPHPVHELMYILEGRADVTDADGSVTRIGPGDAIFVARGTTNSLVLHDNLKKIFAIAENGSAAG